MEDSSYAYLLDWQKLNLPLVLFGGVGAGDGLEAGSLILIPDTLFLTSFCDFFRGERVSVALHLLARVLEDPTSLPTNKSSAISTLQVRAKIVSELVLKPRMVEKKISST
jgi:hypothetical protein